MMNLFKREVRAHLKSLVIWSVGMIFMVAGGMGKYAGYASSAKTLNEFIAQMPKMVQAIMGFSTFDLSKASGFYGVLYSFLAVMAAAHAAILGTEIISKEERDKTAEFLLVKPISRNAVVSSKILAGIFNITVLNGITLVASIYITGYLSNGENVTDDILLLMKGMFILQLLFMFSGTSVAALSKNPKGAVSISAMAVLVTFIVSKVTEIDSRLINLKYITPFKYYDAKDLMYHARLDSVFITLSIFIMGVMAGVTFTAYSKRDLKL
ncbi:MAG: putative rane protein [Clostridia bacterium]|jgi:ABC-2 type transport system permease protein|nr:putative rane protein [Clostridia bacterium]